MNDPSTGNPVQRLTLLENARMGIGQTYPTKKLHIGGNAEVTTELFVPQICSLTDSTQLRLIGGEIGRGAYGGTITLISGKNPTRAGNIAFATGAAGATTKRMTVLLDGKVGIGPLLPRLFCRSMEL